MIRRAFASIGWMAVYGCVATVIAQAIVLAFLARSWQLDRDRAMRALAVAQGVDIPATAGETAAPPGDVSREHVSFEQILETRALKVRNLELREMALAESLGQLAREQRLLREERASLARTKESFETELLAIQQQAASQGMEDTRAKLMAIKSDQAKLLLDDLLDRGDMRAVVTLIRGMPDSKSSKIIGEFKTPEDLERIGEVLRVILEGDATGELAAATAARLQDTDTATP